MDRWDRTRALTSLVCLGLMTLADCVTDSLLLTFASDSQMQPGSWNLRTCAIVLGGVSDVVGQSVLGYVLSTRSKYCAMIINTTSILAAAVVTLSSVLLGHNRSLMAATGGRLIKCVGGGCHGSVFLMLAILHSQKPQHYFAYHYMTGAIGVLTQSLGSLSASRLSRHSHILPGVFSGLCCLMAYSVILFLKKMDADTEERSQDESRPLLSHQQQILRVDDAPASQMAVAGYISRPGGSGSPLRSQDLKFLPIVFVLMGFCKSTRPLFTTYIQHRHGVSPTEAEHLWLLRTVLSVALFVFAGLYTAYIKEPDCFNHVQAKIAILFISAGALAIGLPGSYNTITIGRVQIHTTKSTYGSIMWIHIHSIPFHVGFSISISTPRSPFHMFHMWKSWNILGGVRKYLDFLVKSRIS
ncbi:hypothetical protein FOXG_21034 [Fusarium oxysporum f. sp. lycopersici 4287]|uniref:Uncharacterized protein n=1 Tax=Fusarium oxysporum f. sp. lycopersici (strain 4287 / CBS 123668 / FGSC 9935 / NRRL 34936) TaxID=426428 RepID=A0A0J9VTG7_FUSO4|nr:hypothetical protein FOXG_21034 [Fusarium oxysporum f. sp. lycopersici 4287]XP_018252101.1 hypothetical protein FOXG_21034 [Fusarium oxysporum f. sp. lycopersici 4287]KNB14055.1 hypothetical protein FOXG_21034 [Fusarium oxysporum f. sp. lycopersici 4287]KNB14056.1 hypothetical protein FOXG_21034 [Fusarium oxysporum f. sp. lycopersici 4287]